MKILPVISTKGGEGKSTQAANLCGFLADAGLKTLLIDGDFGQPTASSIYQLTYEAPCGLYELLMQTVDLSDASKIISHSFIPNLDVIISNDPQAHLLTAMLHAPDGRLTRSDRGLIREAIMMAAQTSYDESRQMIAEDLQTALFAIARDNSVDSSGQPLLTERRRARADEMAGAMSMFTSGFEGELFNRPGTPWPEADVTLIDLGTLARENYGAQMALAMVSLVNTINNIAERDQYLDREIVFAIDEAHITTTNPLLSPYMTKVVKMWRKLGAWLWMATQNLADYPDIAEKMLNMAEWWLCLTMPPDEVEQIARFKKLSDEQKSVMLSASKLPRCYTEGVVLSKKTEALFRAVPPSLYLALGMTEKEEKAERRKLMKEHSCSELEAAVIVARQLDAARGLKSAAT